MITAIALLRTSAVTALRAEVPRFIPSDYNGETFRGARAPIPVAVGNQSVDFWGTRQFLNHRQ
jgi:hypothetical protein